MRKAGLTKNRYAQMISEYTTRREKMRRRYGKRASVANPEYRKAVRNINNKLTQWRRAIKRIEERQDRLAVIADALIHYLESIGKHASYAHNGGGLVEKVRIKHSHLDTHPTIVLARKMFYKYCLENGFSSPDIMMYVSGANKNSGRYWATEARRQFTRSFRTNLYHKQMWEGFSSFMKKQQSQKKAA